MHTNWLGYDGRGKKILELQILFYLHILERIMLKDLCCFFPLEMSDTKGKRLFILCPLYKGPSLFKQSNFLHA